MVQKIARVFGVALLVVGILGFVPAAVTDGKLFGIFPVNTFHNVVHILLGLWGLAGSGSFAGAVAYLRAQAMIYGLLAVLGLIPATDTLFGLVPLHGADVALHAVLAAIAAWAGWGLAKQQPA